MSCPTCGGSTRRELAPGWFECLEMWTETRANPVHPALGMQLSPQTCGTRYQEATAATGGFGLCYVCNSIGAVGLCAGCGRPVDGVHGSVSAEGIHCPTCATARLEERRAEAQQRAAAAEADREETIRNLSTVDYLVALGRGEFDVSARSATGAEIADALRHLMPPWPTGSYDGHGALSLGQSTPGTDEILRSDGTLARCVRGRRRNKVSDVHPPDQEYSAADTTRMLRGGLEYIRAISSDNR